MLNLKRCIYTLLGRKVVTVSKFCVPIENKFYTQDMWQLVQYKYERLHYKVQVYYTYKGIEYCSLISMIGKDYFITIDRECYYFFS